MVKNSKYLIALALLFISGGLWAQGGNGKFSPLQRDIEISRVTLENFLKKWDGDPLLNNIQQANGSYSKGKGVEFNIDAPNARIFLDGRIVWRNDDKTLMDTFYDEEIVRLQKERLKESVTKFLADFSSYLPQIETSENIAFVFEVKDPVNKKEEAPDSSPKQKLRTYQIAFSISGADLNTLKSGDLSQNEIVSRIKTATR